MVDIFPAYANYPIRVEFWGDEVEAIREFDPVSGETLQTFENYRIYPANQYVTTKDKLGGACKAIEAELEERVKWFGKSSSFGSSTNPYANGI